MSSPLTQILDTPLETTHLQTLRVVDDESMDLLPNEEDKMIGHNKKIKIDTCLPLPESNGTFKL